MYKDYRYINAGTNEFYRWGKKAIAKVERYLEANEAGYISIPADGGKYLTIGTSDGKYSEYTKIRNTFFSVNKGGYLYAKAGTEKGEALVKVMKILIATMKEHGSKNINDEEDD